jgi:hypothetical protein
VDRRLRHGLRPLRPLDPLRSEAAMFRVLLVVIALGVLTAAVVLIVRAVT